MIDPKTGKLRDPPKTQIIPLGRQIQRSRSRDNDIDMTEIENEMSASFESDGMEDRLSTDSRFGRDTDHRSNHMFRHY